MVHNKIACHPLTNAKPASSGRTLPGQLLIDLFFRLTPYYMEHMKQLWSVGLSCPGCVFSQLLVTPHLPHWQGSMRRPWLSASTA